MDREKYMIFTKEQAISEYRKMWNWIADRIEEKKKYQEIGDLKEDYCIENGFLLKNDCFCCEYAKNNCDNCPIEWKSVLEKFMCEQKHKEDDDEGFYAKCCETEDWKEQSKLARQIANLPERENI